MQESPTSVIVHTGTIVNEDISVGDSEPISVFSYNPRQILLRGYLTLSGQGNVVYPQNHLDSLSRQLDRTCANEERLQHILLGDVGVNTSRLNTNTSVLVAHLVAVSQFCDNLDAVQTSILGQCGGDNLKSVCKGLPANGLGTCQATRLLGELCRNLNLRGTATSDEGLLLDQTSHNTKSIVQTSLGLLQNQRVGTSNNDRHSLADRLGTGNLNHARSGRLNLLNQISVSQLILGERVNVGNGLAASRLADELNLITLNILNS
ncbi:hypothetical protein HG531_002234 [Fusarium graminearum]|nr:hypothetical protein HG531_002234 [Fusarium graminearum]